MEAISEITRIITDINSFQTGVASAVEEQTATVSEPWNTEPTVT